LIVLDLDNDFHERKLNNLVSKQSKKERQQGATCSTQENDARNSKFVVNLSSLSLTEAQDNVLSKGLMECRAS
jgi:hypothetical protein